MDDLGQHVISSQPDCLLAQPHYSRRTKYFAQVKRYSKKGPLAINEDELPAFAREAADAHRQATEEVRANALRQLWHPRKDRTILSAIRNKEILRFIYNGKERIVEPQTYGVSIAGREVLRARQIGVGSSSGRSRMAKLFDFAQMSGLKKTG